jgi:CHAT domain-containing protein/Tfp pilus assembly protein PilF
LAEATALHQRVFELVRQGKYAEALPLAERALAIRKRELGPDNLMVAHSLNQLAAVYRSQGDLARAEPMLLEALRIREAFAGPEGLIVAASLNSLAVVYRDKGDYTGAVAQLRRALSIFEKQTGAESTDTALTEGNLASLYQDMGAYAEAEKHALRALSIRKKVFGDLHPDVALTLNNLASLYMDTGDYLRAESAFQEALRVREKILSEDHPDIAASLANLGSLYQAKGDAARAEELYLRALGKLEKKFGALHPDVATLLNNLASLRADRGDYPEAEKRLRRALEIRERLLGSEHPAVAVSLNNLGTLLVEKGNAAAAGEFFRRASALYEKRGEREHPDAALPLNNLAALAEAAGDFVRAEELYQQALSIRRKALGDKHPDVAATLNNLAMLYWEKGDAARAVGALDRAAEIREHNLSLILTTGTEREKQLYLQTLTSETYSTISLNLRFAPADPQAARVATATLLRRKGRTLDAMTQQMSTLRGRLDPQDRVLLDRLLEVRTRLANLFAARTEQGGAAARRAAQVKLEAELEGVEAQIAARGSALQFSVGAQPVSFEQVQARIPPGAALVEIALYRPLDPKARRLEDRFGPERYAAFVLKREGPPRSLDLGEAAPINREAARFTELVSRPDGVNEKTAGRALDELVMRPLRKLLGDTKTVLLSPDGPLNLVPFAALTDERGRYLVEDYTFDYLTSGRDLVRLEVRAQSRQPPLVFADPSYDAALATAATSQPTDGGRRGLRSTDLRQTLWERLPYTAEEAKELKEALPDAKVLTQADATEYALKQVSGPRILHIATHGFFLDDRPQDSAAARSGQGVGAGAAENPLLRSGLVLAGANNRQGGAGEDGVLTALEAAGLDLHGTKLVVLSACETGVGAVRNGEGVYGLRRSLVLAGAESELMSLWQVNDRATRELMAEYYKHLRVGEGRTEALRNVQLWMLQRKGRSHPHFWAGFIPIGDWRPLAEK